MNCKRCSKVLPVPSDVTARGITCPACQEYHSFVGDDERTLETRGSALPATSVTAQGSEGSPDPRSVSAQTQTPTPTPTPAPTPTPSGFGLQTPSPPEALVGQHIKSGQYHLRSILGGGGMGTVYLAWDRESEMEVAVKILSPQLQSDPLFVKRFHRESEVLKSLQHIHIVHIHARGVDEGGRQYIVMPFIKGRSNARQATPLSALLREAEKRGDVGLEVPLVLKIMKQALAALHYAHTRNVIHRDIKPGNMLIDDDDNVRLVDFGIASGAAGGATEMTLTTAGSALGTPQYVAPEQWRDPTSADARSDVYSLGVVLYKLLTNSLPEGRWSPPSKFRPNLDPRFDEIVSKALEPIPADRFQTAKDLDAALDALSTPRAGSSSPGGTPTSLNAGAGRDRGGAGEDTRWDPTKPNPAPAPSRGRLYIVATVVGLLVIASLILLTRGPSLAREAERLRQAIVTDDSAAFDRALNTKVRQALVTHQFDDASHQTPLHLTAIHARSEMAEKLLVLVGNQGLKAGDDFGKTPLHLVVRSPDDTARGRVAKYFLNKDADPDQTDRNNKSSFDLALDGHYTNLAMLIGGVKIKRHLDAMTQDPSRGPAETERIKRTIERMKDAGIDMQTVLNQDMTEGGGSLLDLFNQSEQEQITKTLFQLPLDSTNWVQVFRRPNRNGLTGMQQAAINRKFGVVRIFLENLDRLGDAAQEKAVVDEVFRGKSSDASTATTLIHLAVDDPAGQTNVVPLLLSRNARLDQLNGGQAYPLHTATRTAQIELALCMELLRRSTNSTVDIPGHFCGSADGGSNSVLELAIRHRDPETFKEFIQDLLVLRPVIVQPTVGLALSKTNLSLVTQVINRRERWNTERSSPVPAIVDGEYKDPKDKVVKPLLHIAVNHGNVDLVRALLAAGAKTNSVHDGKTPVQLAEDLKHAEVIALLKIRVVSVDEWVQAHVDRGSVWELVRTSPEPRTKALLMIRQNRQFYLELSGDNFVGNYSFGASDRTLVVRFNDPQRLPADFPKAEISGPVKITALEDPKFTWTLEANNATYVISKKTDLQ